MNGNEADINVLEEIEKLKKKTGKLSSVEKILLSTDGTVTTILDILNGKTAIKILSRETKKADKSLSKLCDIDEGEKVSCRVILMHKNGRPLIYAESFIPDAILRGDFKTDMLFSDIPIGRVLRKHNIESRREVVRVNIEPGNDMLKDIFKNETEFLSREYKITSGGKTLAWIKEIFPSDYFK
ncbi:MAG: chorismate pyruvate-lyase family protein [Endomicrobium sp.]|jgi:chorismate-pyruvate lyase|nr:chorismate pyruvate-lyase family protein [Endomicrobium sp.]